MATINRIKIPCTETIRAAYDLDATCGIFEGTVLSLPVAPNSYRQINDREVQRIEGYSTTMTLISTKVVAIEFTVEDARIEIMDVLNALMAEVVADTTDSTRITLHDYVLPERADRATGYTIRTGIFTQIEPQGGTVRDSDVVTSRRSGLGIQVRFEELDRRNSW